MSHPAGPGEIPQPISQIPGPVRNVFEVPGSLGELDMESARLAQEFLEQRLVDDPQGWHGLALGWTEGRVPVPTVGPREWHDTGRPRLKDGYWITGKVALAFTIGSALLFNYHPIHALENNAGIGAFNMFDHPGPTKTPILAEGKTVQIIVDAHSADSAGKAEVDPHAVAEFRDEVRTALDKGGNNSYIQEMESYGTSSDEGFDGITVADPEGQGNNKLAELRADEAADQVRTAFGHEAIPTINKRWSEHVLKPRQAAKLEKLAQKAGFPDLDSAVAALDAGEPMNPKLAAKIYAAFPAQRGATLSAKVFQPGKSKVVGEKVTPGEGLPYDEVNGWNLFPFLIPVRRLGWKKVQRRRWLPKLGLKDGFRLPRLYKINQDEENVEVRVMPEAVQEDGTLVDRPWTKARKQVHEARNDLWKLVLRADWKDKDSKDQALRLIFVNFTPTKETEDLYGKALKIFAASHDMTQVAKIISAFFIYPAEDAGTEHNDPGRISVGDDKQDEPDIYGYCMPLLEKCEMHMPATQDPVELATMFDEFTENRVGVLGHELTHAATAVPEKQTLRGVLARRIRRAMIPVGPRWLNPMEPVNGVVLPQNMQYHPDTPPLQFNITYRVADADGKVTTVNDTAERGDGRFGHLIDAEIDGYQITGYSGTDYQENGAEVGRANVTEAVQGQRVPWSEAGELVRTTQLDNGEPGNFVTGYRPDPRAQAALARHMGARPDEFPFAFDNPPQVTITAMDPEDDPVMRQAMIDARGRRFPAPDDMVAILAGIRR